MVTATALSSLPRRVLGPVPAGAEAMALAHLLKHNTTILHVAVNDRALEHISQALPFFAPEAEVLHFPAWDCLPYDRVSPRASLMAERLRTLALLHTTPHANRIVLTTSNAFVQRVLPPDVLKNAVMHIRSGSIINRDQLLTFLATNGYRHAARAIEPGEFAPRGGIVDIMPAGETQGARLDFFGDTLESIRSFDPLTQRSAEALKELILYPASEILLNEQTVEYFRTQYRAQFGAVSKEDPLYDAISAHHTYPGMEHWLPLFYPQLTTLAEYLPHALITLEAEAPTAIAERQETIKDYYEARRAALSLKEASPYQPLPPEQHYLLPADTDLALEKRETLQFSPFSSDTPLPYRAGLSLASQRHGTDSPFTQIRDYASAKRTEGKTTIIACYTSGSCERVSQLLAQHNMHGVRMHTLKDARNISGKTIGIALLPLERGFETDNLAIVTEKDWFGEGVLRTRARKKPSEAFLAEAAHFTAGELVVHREHGIGRFDGLVTLEVQLARHDCLKIIYDGGDRLFLPVENIELLSRFGSETEGVQLDKLGAASWQARKARMKERIHLAAEALLKTAAERLLKPGAVLTQDEAYARFCEGFPYVETEDQQRAIDDVLADLASGRPMDRLICGDVGFGKTEVALRAAFVAANATPKTQVALIAPTTLLARQHFRNFRARFEGFGLEIRQLSRMVSARQQQETRTLLAEGKVDIVIGTHALLSKNVHFANLGLIIVDEEQHFGVAQKEKLKSLKSDVHVLTLSATPIPRTLQMALAGVRDLSLITTPPVDRLAVRSFVMPWDGVVLREAILRERHRSGQIFVVTPRIQDLGDLKVKLKELVPEIKLAVAHGQMSATALEAVMNDFYDGKYDLLLSTAIVESGLDIPAANTIIIHRADRFGLGQLYQLRGRVGRGKLRAYAYLLLPHGRDLTRDATRRLEVMQSLDTLGAGFQLASHDMDIRGFGNLVGEEQSGHIREVGIELYQQMLSEAVSSLQAAVHREETLPTADRQLQTDWSPTINLGLSVLIPESYVIDLDLRLGLYRRAGTLQTLEDLADFTAELKDRFGPLPQEVEHLLATVRMKQLCKQAGIERIDAGPKGAVLAFRDDAIRNPEALLAYIARHPTRLKLRPDQKLVIMEEWNSDPEKITAVMKWAEALSHL